MTHNSQTPRILVVDDAPSIHDDFRKVLTPAAADDGLAETEAALFGKAEPRSRVGFRVAFAHQGEEALRMVARAREEADPFAVAFVDMRMPPGWDGVETTRELWKADPELQVVLCTAFSDYSWTEIRAELGSHDGLLVLRKPFDNIEVLQLAHSLSKKWALARQAALRLLETEDRFRRAFEVSPAAIEIARRDDGRILDVNRAYLETFQVERAEVLEATAVGLGLWQDASTRETTVAELVEPGGRRGATMELRARDGSPRTVLVSAEPCEIDGEACVLTVFSDLTDHVALEEQLRQAQKMETVGELAAGIAHDFNNLLTVIGGHVQELLGSGTLEADAQASLREVAEAAGSAGDLTSRLLAFCRRQVLERRPVELDAFVQDEATIVRRVLEESIELVVDLGAPGGVVHADAALLRQVVLNLALNARDAMPDGGRLRMRTRPCRDSSGTIDGPGFLLELTDEGCGIPPEHLGRVFEPFFTTKASGAGTGLGLSMVYGIVEQHGGRLEVESRVGEGTTIRVLLAASEGTPERRPAAPGRAEPGRGETILVVEDEGVVRELVRKTLERKGYRVVEAGSGPEALGAWRAARGAIDLVFTDMVMPGGMSGKDVADRLRLEAPNLEVILTSGYATELAGQSTSSLGPITFLPKPYLPETVATLVRERLDRRRPRVDRPVPAEPERRESTSSRASASPPASGGTPRPRILVVDDNRHVRTTFAMLLSGLDLDVETVESAEVAVERLAAGERRYVGAFLDVQLGGSMTTAALLEEIERRCPELLERTALVTGDPGHDLVQVITSRHPLPVIEKPFVTSDLERVLGTLGPGS